MKLDRQIPAVLLFRNDHFVRVVNKRFLRSLQPVLSWLLLHYAAGVKSERSLLLDPCRLENLAYHIGRLRAVVEPLLRQLLVHLDSLGFLVGS